MDFPEFTTSEHLDGVCIIALSRAPVNALSAALRENLLEEIRDAVFDEAVKAIVITSLNDLPFSAGADIKEFSTPSKIKQEGGALNWFWDAFELIQNADKPVIAAISKYALGGGLELALASHYRVAVGPVKLGLPEVQIGILPGGGGTQLLPRKIGIMSAVEMICTGQPVTGHEALKLGLLDAYDADAESAKSFALHWLKMQKPKVRKVHHNAITDASVEAQKVLQQVTVSARGRIASVKACQSILNTLHMDLRKGLEAERALFLELLTNDQSLALRYIFFSERMAVHVPGCKLADEDGIGSVAVVGGGLMGSGIAMSCLKRSIPVHILEVNADAIDVSRKRIEETFKSAVLKQKMSAKDMQDALSLLHYTSSYEDLHGADLIIEAAFENMDIKKDIFHKLDKFAKKNAILASNTSGLDVNVLARGTEDPTRVIGLHFFSPAHIMPLVEIVRQEKTDDEILARSIAFVKRLKKKPVTVGVCPGFVGNRMLEKYLAQAILLLERGVAYTRIDQVLNAFGMPMGPFQMLDMSGLDLVVKRDPGGASIFHHFTANGRLGQKSGGGFYDYREGSFKGMPSKEAEKVLQNWASKQSSAQDKAKEDVSDEEILHRCLYALIDEAVAVLQDGIALRGSDIDVIYIYGYGWPSYRGGPCWYADSVGLDTIYARILAFREKDQHLDQDHWSCPLLWKKLDDENKKLSQYQSKL